MFVVPAHRTVSLELALENIFLCKKSWRISRKNETPSCDADYAIGFGERRVTPLPLRKPVSGLLPAVIPGSLSLDLPKVRAVTFAASRAASGDVSSAGDDERPDTCCST